MKDQPANTTSRRELLRGALSVALGVGCFTSLSLRVALREARAAGKPLLIESEINRMIPPPQNRQAYLATIDFTKRDLLGYLTANFQLTPQQIAEVRSIPREDLLRFNALLDHARMTGKRITVRIMQGRPGAPMPNAVYLRVGPGIHARSIPSAEEQSIPQGDPNMIQERKVDRNMAENERLHKAQALLDQSRLGPGIQKCSIPSAEEQTIPQGDPSLIQDRKIKKEVEEEAKELAAEAGSKLIGITAR